jgi:flagellar motility protein MotE (MotC chaperone)
MKTPQLKSPRLLPVVIAAAAALLIFKGIGIMSGTGYVLTGPGPALAEGGGGGGGEAPVAAGSEATMSLPSDPSMEDTSPTLEDTSVTLGAKPAAEGGGHGGTPAEGEAGATDAAAGDHAATPAEGEAGAPAADAAHGAEAPAVAEAAATTCPPADAAAPAADGTAAAATAEAKPTEAAAAGDHGATTEGGKDFAATDCIPTTASGDALPMMTNGAGQMVPVSDATAGSTPQILERLGERRTELDKRAAELDAREALLAAAEKQLEEKNAALKALQDQMAQQEQQTKAADGQQMTSLVTMYEQMKPKDAAVILGQLDLDTLTRVAKAISPRKMGPILAKMDPAKAEALTAALAATPVAENTAAPDLSKLPQIVGK